MSPVDPHFVSTSDFARRLWVDGTTSIYATLSEGLTKSRGVPPVANVYRLESGQLPRLVRSSLPFPGVLYSTVKLLPVRHLATADGSENVRTPSGDRPEIVWPRSTRMGPVSQLGV